MKDEIKEILDYFRTYATIKEVNMIKKVYDYITNLQEENERLKEKLEDKIDLYEDTISYQLGYDKGSKVYKSRNEKAIEYIKEKARNNSWIDQYEANDLINILEGDKDD